jgi:hypothetical protein
MWFREEFALDWQVTQLFFCKKILYCKDRPPPTEATWAQSGRIQWASMRGTKATDPLAMAA